MANNKNLIPLNQRTKSEQREIAKSGGIASGIARQEKRKIKDVLKELLDNPTADGKTNREALCVSLLNQALDGNVKAFEVIRDTIGEKPVAICQFSKEELEANVKEVRSVLFAKETEAFTIIVANQEIKDAILAAGYKVVDIQ